MRIVAVLWPDNTMDVGEDDTDILDAVAASQFSGSFTRQGVKTLLADRAYVWSGAQVADDLEDGEFLDALERAGVCLVERFDA